MRIIMLLESKLQISTMYLQKIFISSFALKRALQMKLCIFILSSLVLLTLTGITLAGDEEI